MQVTPTRPAPCKSPAHGPRFASRRLTARSSRPHSQRHASRAHTGSAMQVATTLAAPCKSRPLGPRIASRRLTARPAKVAPARPAYCTVAGSLPAHRTLPAHGLRTTSRRLIASAPKLPAHCPRIASRRLTARGAQGSCPRPAHRNSPAHGQPLTDSSLPMAAPCQNGPHDSPPTIDPPIGDSLARDVCLRLSERGMS